MAHRYLSGTAREDIALFRGIPDPKEGVHCTLQVALHCKYSNTVRDLLLKTAIPLVVEQSEEEQKKREQKQR